MTREGIMDSLKVDGYILTDELIQEACDYAMCIEILMVSAFVDEMRNNPLEDPKPIVGLTSFLTPQYMRDFIERNGI